MTQFWAPLLFPPPPCHRVAQVLANLPPLLLESWICPSLEAISSILHVCIHVGRGQHVYEVGRKSRCTAVYKCK